MNKKGKLYIISAPSGTGKSTVIRELLKKKDNAFFSVSATTREPREGEVNGVNYWFLTRPEFERMVEEGAFLEHACFNGNYYGTPKAYVESLTKQGKDVLLEIEVQGALQVKEIFPDAVLLFVTPPSADALKERLVGRGTETPEEIKIRLAISTRESRLMEKYDYLIVNDDIEEAVRDVHDIIETEGLRTSRNRLNIEEMRSELQKFAKGEEKL